MIDMAKGNSNKRAIKAIHDEAMIIARSLQKAGQTKEETRLIAQGIQKGLEQYKKQQSIKERELDKKLKQVKQDKKPPVESDEQQPPVVQIRQHWLPWLLLLLSWLGIAGYMLS